MAIINLGVLGPRRMGAFGSVDPNLKAKLRAVRQTKKDFRLLSLFILVITIFLAFDCLAAPASKELNYEIRSSDGTANKIRQRRAATARLDRLWDDAVIPYEIDPIFSEDRSALFRSAMRHWENYTCIKFVERNQDEHRDYIVFTERSCGCCSFVGKRGNGAQAISIGKHCDKFGIVVHELGHVVGFWHEHTRPDRDQHVQIIGKNIMTGQEYNFNKLTRDEVNSLGLAYDYDSILHYATNTFAKDTYLDTILPLHGHLNTEEVMNHQRESANQNHQPASATAVNATSAPSTAFTNNSTATGTSQQAIPKQNQTNPHMINDESRLKRIEMVRKSIEEDFHSMLQYAGVPAVKRNNSGSKRLQGREDDRILLLDGGIVVSLAKGSAATLDKSNQPSEKSRRFARHASPVDIDDGQLMLSTDNVLAKVRPEIGQRVRLSVGDIAQTNLLYKCPKCGRTIQQLGGMFHSPNYHSNSNQDHQKLDGHGDLRGQHGESCEWRLTVGIGERIMITIADLDMAHPVDDAPSSAGLSPTSKMGLPRGELTQTELRDLNNQQRATSGPPAEADSMIMTDCHRDYVEIRDGYTYRAPVIARLCGHISRLRDTNRPIVSTSNRLIVSYHTSSKSIGKRGFLAHHETICGGFILLGNAPYDTDTTASALVSGSRAQSSGSSSSSTVKSHNGQASTTTTSNRQDSFRLNGSSVDVTSVRNATNGTSPSENEVLLSSQTTARSGLQAHQAVNASASHQHKSITDSPAAIAHSNLMKIPATTTTTTSTASVVPDSLAFSWDTWPMLNTTIIQSPNWPEQYRASRECLWQIRAEDNYQIALRFETFDLEPHDSCAYDYVEVRDGETTSSELLGRFCGNRVPSQVLSSGSNMLVKFVSDSDVNKPGFFASVQPEIDECKLGTHGCSYKCSNAAIPYRCECPSGLELAQDGKSCIPTCGGLRNDSSGQITSPSFPDLYPISTRCVWEIRAPLNHRITLNFTHFELEGIRTQECDYDYVEIWSRASDGKSSKNGIYCGLNQAFSVTSIANSMRIEFVSDNSIQKSGFEAKYFIDRDECSSNNGGCQQICKNTIGSYQCLCNNGFVLHENNHDCIGSQFLQTITSPDGSIHSPNFPNLYQPNKEYAWLFSTAPSHRIKLIFDQFDLESHQECAYDHVAVFDGEGVDDHALGRFCGSRRPLTLASSFNKLYLVFRSDATNEKRGFNATHTTICGGRLQANVNHHGQIYSHPLFDGSTHYNRNEDCEWIIEANENQRVRIEFTFFALEADGNCNYDQISVYDGSDDAASQLARLCGTDIPKEQLRITSSGESMLIVFKSDDSINGKGFSLTYTAVEVNEDETLAITYVTESKFTQPT